MSEKRFPSPFDVPTPEGCEGWEELYPYYYLFSEDRRELEESKFWFFDSMHHPEVLYPFDTITSESWWVALGEMNSRVYIVPPALGIDHRVLNGRLYVSANAIMDEEVVGARVAHFMERAGYYYQNWDDLYAKWKDKANETINELKAIQVTPLPEMEALETVHAGRGLTTAYDLMTAYNRTIENMHKMWHLHFEFLNLGYAAYLTYFGFCKQVFPDIADQTVAQMVAGIDVLLFQPDKELKKLAKKAVELGVTDAFKNGNGPEEALAILQGSDSGQRWIAELEKAKDPWFYFSTGSGFYHHHKTWINDMTFPFSGISGYIAQLEAGESIERPIDEVRAERDRLSDEYAALLDGEDLENFQNQLGLARTVFPYIEDHNFYVEHWHHAVFWNKMREFGQIFVDNGFFEEVDDMFYLHRDEVRQALYDMIASWAVGTPARGPKYWPPEVARRKELFDKLSQWSPLPALGEPPEVVTEPFTIMLWGVTTDSIQNWLGISDGDDGGADLKGFAGSPGVVEGPARVILSADQLGEIQDGEILVCPITNPSWGPIFSRITAVVTDIGGMMSHAAIVCREYGVPAVVGTAFGTQKVTTGQRLRVDGSS
ncbi:MAG: PEP-utilizing protein mobile subunit, partial [Chloroflexi bacterium]|nr:PEP-utilizing protein mobile subunit [Chloroflexota bacterium]